MIDILHLVAVRSHFISSVKYIRVDDSIVGDFKSYLPLCAHESAGASLAESYAVAKFQSQNSCFRHSELDW